MYREKLGLEYERENDKCEKLKMINMIEKYLNKEARLKNSIALKQT
jgi:hypothetical protein